MSTVIAIDGPAGSGKSTLAKALAHKLGYIYLDTGAMYRALTYLALQDKLDLADEKALSKLAQANPVRFKARGRELEVYIGNKEVTKEIRLPEVDKNVSEVSAHPRVREIMVAQQKAIGAEHDLVAEGRDMGTVVFPDATLKVFLSADAKTRAHRRYLQNKERAQVAGSSPSQSEEEIYQAIIARDAYDSQRESSPLKPAEDAVLLDSSYKSEDEVLNYLLKLLEIPEAGGINGR